MVDSAHAQQFIQLLRQHERIIYKVARAYCGDAEARRDLLQDIVSQVWRAFASFDPSRGVAFSTWLYRIAMNVAISHFRAKTRRAPEISLEDLGFDLAAAEAAFVAAGDNVRILQQLLSELNALDRALVLLHLEGHDAATIAAVLGISCCYSW